MRTLIAILTCARYLVIYMVQFLKSAFSEKGQPSSSRLLMAVFSVFTMAVIWKILAHLLKLSAAGNEAMPGVSLSNLPLIISSLCLLIALAASRVAGVCHALPPQYFLTIGFPCVSSVSSLGIKRPGDFSRAATEPLF